RVGGDVSVAGGATGSFSVQHGAGLSECGRRVEGGGFDYGDPGGGCADGDVGGGVAGVSAAGADGADRGVAGAVCGERGAGDAGEEWECPGLCEAVCELRREYSRGAVY